MNYIELAQDGSITVAAQNVSEAKLALKELKFQKKALSMQKKEINEQMRQIRSAYTDHTRRQGSKFVGGGWLGKLIRGGQTGSRDAARKDLANRLYPYEQKKQWIENTSVRIDQAVLRVEVYIHENS